MPNARPGPRAVIAAASRSSSAFRRAASATWAPSAASSRAMASPRPEDAPVTRATLPFNPRSMEPPIAGVEQPQALDNLLVTWLIGNMTTAVALRALANERRLQILEWLKDPREHFPPQVD